MKSKNRLGKQLSDIMQQPVAVRGFHHVQPQVVDVSRITRGHCLPSPRPLQFHEYTETRPGHVIDCDITVGWGPWKHKVSALIRGGGWVARASSRSRK